MSRNSICCMFNYAPHYREPIYSLMDKELDCDFYFGNSAGTPIKEMDLSKLQGFKKKLIRKSVTPWNYIWLVGALKPIFRNYKFYIVSGDSKYLTIWLLLVVGKLCNKKVFIWGHGIKGNKSKTQAKIDLLFYRLCHKVLLYGHFSREKMIELGIKPHKLEVIYNSLNYERQIKFRKETQATPIYRNRFNNSNPTILYIGRLQKSKKLELLVQLKEQLDTSGVPVNLVFIGKDIGDNNLVTHVNNSGFSDEIWFYGPCYDEDTIADLIQQAQLCISPGPIGLTALHVATYGLPIITNDDYKNQMPEFEVIREGLNGAFFEEGNFESLYLKVRQWLGISEDKRSEAKKYSEKLIDTFYNPNFQLNLLKELTTLNQ